MSFDVTTLALAKTYTNQHSGGGGQVQPDWNQNDETAKDYVKNRTHWMDDDGTVHKLNPQFLPDNYGGSVDPDDIAKAVADYLAAHPIKAIAG